jgi:hypothetical protein
MHVKKPVGHGTEKTKLVNEINGLREKTGVSRRI